MFILIHIWDVNDVTFNNNLLTHFCKLLITLNEVFLNLVIRNCLIMY